LAELQNGLYTLRIPDLGYSAQLVLMRWIKLAPVSSCAAVGVLTNYHLYNPLYQG
jgi:hypothetical protein